MRLTLLLAVILAGCSLVGDESAEVSFVVTAPEAAPTPVRASAALDGRGVALTPLPDTGGRTTFADPVERRAGTTSVGCLLTSDTAETALTISLDLEPGFRYPIQCAVQATNPADGCFGCAGSASAALDPALGLASDQTLWMVWGEVSIDSPVLY